MWGKYKHNKAMLKILFLTMSSLLIVFPLIGCGPSAPPETRAGEWKASTDFGEFTLFVDPSGTTITSIEFSQSCSSKVTFSGTINLDEGLPIENNKFTLELESAPSMKFQGTFSKDGTSASGSWKAGDCSDNWKVTRS